MPVPFLNSVNLNKNEVQNFKVFNIGNDPTPTLTANDGGYFWFDSTTTPTPVLRLKYWTGTEARTLLDSASTTIVAADLSGGAAGSLPYQVGAGNTDFLGIGAANQVLTVKTDLSGPQWTSQSNLSVGTATWLAGGAQGDIPVQSSAGQTGFLNIGAAGRILTSDGSTPVWSATIPSSSVSGLAASATTDTTNAANITSGLLPLARLELADGSFYVGNGSNVPTATAKNLIPISGFGAATAAVAMGNQKITGLADPVDATDAANRKYVDEVAQGLDVKASCLVATIANIDLSAPGSSIDGISLAPSNRVLVKDQTDKKQNGIYVWNGAAVAMTRSLDADTVAKLVGAFTFVEQGTNADSGWVCQVDSGTIGSVDIEWTKFSQAGSYTAGNGMVLSGGVFHFAKSTAYTEGQIPFCSNTPTANRIGFSSNLSWDNSNNRLGIGTATPRVSLDVASGEIYSSGQITWGGSSPTANQGFLSYTGGNAAIGSAGATALLLYTNSSERLRIASDGVCTWSNVGGVAGTAMTLNATGLGVGATPSAAIHSAKAAAANPTGGSAAGAGLYVSNVNPLYGMMFGVNGGGVGWIQQQRSDTNTQYDLSLQPLGGNVGIGTATPLYTLDVAGDTRIGGTGLAYGRLTVNKSTSGSTLNLSLAGTSGYTELMFTNYNDNTGASGWTSFIRSNTNAASNYASDLVFGTSSPTLGAPVPRMTLDHNGNLGLGVTPSAWGSSYKAIQIGQVGSINYKNFTIAIGGNYYNDGTNDVTLINGYRSKYEQNLSNGTHIWYQAGIGTGNVSWNQSMTLDASGNLGIGTASPSNRVEIRGAGQATASVADSGDGSALMLSDTGFGSNAGGLLLFGYNVQNGYKAQVGIKLVGIDGFNNGRGDMVFVTRTSTSATTLTEKMRLDSSGNLGIGTASPNTNLTIGNDGNGSATVKLGFSTAYAERGSVSMAGNTGELRLTAGFSGYGGFTTFYTNGSLAATLSSDGNLGLGVTPASTVRLDVAQTSRISFFVNGADTEMRSTNLAGSAFAKGTFNATSFDWGLSNSFGKMVLDASGRLLVGTTNTYDFNGQANLVVAGTANNSTITLASTGIGYIAFADGTSGTSRYAGRIDYNHSTDSMVFHTAAVDRLTLNASGNLGLAATPSAWISAYRAIEIGTTTGLYGRADSTMELSLALNCYRDNSGAWVYRNNGTAALYNQNVGYHYWYSATAGTATNNITFGDPKMTLDASGNLLVGVTSATGSGKIQTASSIRISDSGSETNALLISSSATASTIETRYGTPIIFGTNAAERARLTSSGVLLFSTNGTASAPTIANSDNPDTGLYWPTDADTLALAVGGSDAVYIDANRNVGFGCTPSAPITVKSRSSDNLSIRILQSSGGAGNIQWTDDPVSVQWGAISVTSSVFSLISNSVLTFSTNATERLRIKSTGQINFASIAPDPTGAAGDLYYSTGNVLKMHNGTAWQQLSRKYTVALNDGSVTVAGNAYTITHNMGSQDITVSVRRTTDNAVVLTDVSMPNNTTAIITFAAAITASQYVVTVIG